MVFNIYNFYEIYTLEIKVVRMEDSKLHKTLYWLNIIIVLKRLKLPDYFSFMSKNARLQWKRETLILEFQDHLFSIYLLPFATEI